MIDDPEQEECYHDPPAASIFIIIEVPDRGSPDTITMVSLFI